MLTLLPLLAALTATTPATDWQALYDGGQSFAEFMEQVDSRTAAWKATYEAASVPDSLAERARAVGGAWHLLVVAEDWCSDSVNIVPLVARLSEAVEGMDLRIIGSDAGDAILDAHRSPDGRKSTPTVVLLDADFVPRGTFVERPAPLQEWAVAERAGMTELDFVRKKQQWYDADGGATTLSELVSLVEAAGADHHAH